MAEKPGPSNPNDLQILATVGLEKYEQILLDANVCNMSALVRLVDRDLQNIGIVDDNDKAIFMRLAQAETNKPMLTTDEYDFYLIVRNVLTHLRHIENSLEVLEKDEKLQHAPLCDYGLSDKGPTAIEVLKKLLVKSNQQCEIITNALHGVNGVISQLSTNFGFQITRHGHKALNKRKKFKPIVIMAAPVVIVLALTYALY